MAASTFAPAPAGYEIPVLMYHQVLASRAEAGRYNTWVLESELRKQLAYLRRAGYRTLTFRDLPAALAQPATTRPKYVILTFDDGYADNYDRLFPLLREFGFTAVIYLVTRRESNAWNVAEGEPEVPLMTPAQVREMATYGVEMGGHTCSHVNFDHTPAAVARAEIFDNFADLTALLGAPPVSFAYPYGAYHPTVAELVQAAGFRYAVATRSGPTTLGADPYRIRRIEVSYRTSLLNFRLRVSGFYLNRFYGLLRGLGIR